MGNELYFRRLENAQKTNYIKLDSLIKDAETWAGEKTFNNGISTNIISPIGPDVTINTVTAQSLLKGKTFNIEGQNVLFSASAFNAVRASTSSFYTNTLKPDSISVITDAFSGIFVSTVNGLHCNYNGSNNLWVFVGGGRGSTTATITVYNVTTSAYIFNSQVFVGDFPPFAQLYSVPTGVYNITVDITGAVTGGAYVGIRRCKYPIAEDDPIKVYNSSYSGTIVKKVTLSDINNFLVG